MKRKRPKTGRPIAGAERKQQYKVSLEPRIAEKLRRLAAGNLSRGIAIAAEPDRTTLLLQIERLPGAELARLAVLIQALLAESQ